MTERIPISDKNLIRVAGVAAALGGLAWTANVLFGGGGMISPLLLAMSVLLAGGIAGLYLRYGTGSSPGASGLAQSLVGLALIGSGSVSDAAGYGVARQLFSFGLIILALGLVLVGFSYLKDEPMPRLNSLPLGIGLLVPLSLILGPIPQLGLVASVLFGAGWMLLGALLVADAGGAKD